MENKQQILAFIGDLVDLYRESEEIVIESNPSNLTADFEELDNKCAELMYCAGRLVA